MIKLPSEQVITVWSSVRVDGRSALLGRAKLMSTIKCYCEKWWFPWSSDGEEGPGQAPADGVVGGHTFIISLASFLPW